MLNPLSIADTGRVPFPPRSVLILVCLCATLAGSSGPASAASAAKPWATVNLCDSADRPGAVGVRVAMPSGAGAQWMRVRIEYYDAAAGHYRFAASGGDGGWTRLGSGRRGVRGGTTFRFAEPAAGSQLILRGSVDLEWRHGTHVRRRATVRTMPGHGASAGGTSLAECVIRR